MTSGSVRAWKRPLFRRVAGGLAWGMTAEVAAKGSLFLVTIYLAAVLGAANFGLFVFLQTVFVFVWMGVDLGLNMYAVREVARRPGEAHNLIADFSGMRLILALALAGSAVLVMWLSGAGAVQLWLACGFSLYLIVRAIQPDWVLRGLERYFELTLVSVATAVILLLVTYAMVDERSDVRLASLPWFLSYLLGTVGIYLVLRYRIPALRLMPLTVRPRLWLAHWRESVHFTLSNGVSTLYQNIPIIYVYYLGSDELTGLFAAPFRLAVAMIFVTSVVPMVVYPVFTDLHNQGRTQVLSRLVGVMSVAMLVGAGAITGVLFPFAENVTELLFGPAYRDSAGVLRWLCIFFLLRSVRAVFVRAVCAAGHQRDYSVVSILAVAGLLATLAALTFVGLNPLLAAPVALTACEAAVVIAMGLLTARTVVQQPPWQFFRSAVSGGKLES